MQAGRHEPFSSGQISRWVIPRWPDFVAMDLQWNSQMQSSLWRRNCFNNAFPAQQTADTMTFIGNGRASKVSQERNQFPPRV